MDANDVMPNDAAAGSPPAPEAAPEQAEPAATPPLPPALLKIPAFSGLLTGKPGAFSVPIKEAKNRTDLQDFAKYKDYLGKAGMAVYTALDGKTGVVFNQLYIHSEELKAADAAGQLTKLAPPFDQVNHAISKMGTAHPALDSGHSVPTGLKGAPIPQPPQSADVPPMAQAGPAPESAGVQRKVMAARLTNMQPGSPTSGPVPGAGNLLRQVLKPVI